jgi:glycerol uptake facilitator protein
MLELAAELFGTMILIVFGDGVVANVCLKDSKGQGSGWIVIATGWAMGVTMAVYAVGRISGAHINPAVTVALASVGAFPWGSVPAYLAAQVAGGFLGGVLVWLIYLKHWRPTEDPTAKLSIFCTVPAIRHRPANFLTEFLATAVFLFVLTALGDHVQVLERPGDLDLSVVYSGVVQPLLVGLLVLAVGLSLGGPTGYAINPARDLGPRLAHALLPIPGKGASDWAYSWVPILGPLAGGLVGTWTYTLIGF